MVLKQAIKTACKARVVCPPIRGVAALATVLDRIVGPLLVTERS
jgi:hypothetical protein